MTKRVLCDRDTCTHNHNQECTADTIGLVDMLCITRRKRPAGDNYRDLMRSPVPPFNRESVSSAKVTGRLK